MIGNTKCNRLHRWNPYCDLCSYHKQTPLSKQKRIINAMIACDHDMNIRFVDARYAGSTHDSFVWNNSSLKACLEAAHQNGDQNSIYLGDSGYPLSPYLLTPFRHAESGTRESIFNKNHAKAKNVVERTIGVLKCRFRCLLSDRKMRYDPAKVTSVINVCCALHSICKKIRIGDPEIAAEDKLLMI
ncbi:putative nuclease HARBI1 [Bactrocera tryoni]|uniref:putative nuclease HARBI1 n=1 Tax=Bactrocera tryoni TaxID=59916 RepID=UPI001A978BC9|nr:putative nuclease HARBI1 [Bactrocera tryoni]